MLAHKRPLALNMIRRLTQGLRIPTDTLISQCQEDVETDMNTWGTAPPCAALAPRPRKVVD